MGASRRSCRISLPFVFHFLRAQVFSGATCHQYLRTGDLVVGETVKLVSSHQSVSYTSFIRYM